MEETRKGIFPRWVLVLGGVLLVGTLLYVLRGVLTPVFFAFIIAYMLDPLVDRFERMKLPRSVGIVIVLGLALAAVGLFLLLVLPSVVADMREFAQELPRKWRDIRGNVEPLLSDLGVEMPDSVDDLVAQLGGAASADEGSSAAGAGLLDMAGRAAGPVGAVIQWIVGGTASALGAVAGLIMVPVLAFYLLHDFDRITVAFRDLVPARVRPFVVDVAREVDQVLSQFIRGQVTVMILLAVLYAVGYSIAGIRLAVVIGIVAGLLSFIPYVGGALALGLALLMCALDFTGWWQVGGVLAVYVVIQLLEGFVITPKIVGDKVGLPAVWVLLALMVGGEIFGFMGVLLALPAAAVIKIFVVRGLSKYRKSGFFLAADAAGADGGTSTLAALLHEEGLPDDLALAAEKDRAEEAAEQPAQDTPASEEPLAEAQSAEEPVPPGPATPDGATGAPALDAEPSEPMFTEHAPGAAGADDDSAEPEDTPPAEGPAAADQPEEDETRDRSEVTKENA